jgi:hypothetical protein
VDLGHGDHHRELRRARAVVVFRPWAAPPGRMSGATPRERTRSVFVYVGFLALAAGG